MQMMMNAHADNSEEKQDDKEHDKDFKEVYGNLGKRRKDLFIPIKIERESDKDQRTIQNKRQTSKKIFVFTFVFTWCEHSLNKATIRFHWN